MRISDTTHICACRSGRVLIATDEGHVVIPADDVQAVLDGIAKLTGRRASSASLIRRYQTNRPGTPGGPPLQSSERP